MRYKITKLVQNSKPAKYKGEDETRFRSIVLVSNCGKELEQLFINRVKPYVFHHVFINRNQYGFIR